MLFKLYNIVTTFIQINTPIRWSLPKRVAWGYFQTTVATGRIKPPKFQFEIKDLFRAGLLLLFFLPIESRAIGDTHRDQN